jgi:hypothetical protein
MLATTEQTIRVVGIDIGKNSFHIVGLDDRGAIVLRQKWSRGQVQPNGIDRTLAAAATVRPYLVKMLSRCRDFSSACRPITERQYRGDLRGNRLPLMGARRLSSNR